MKRSWKEEQIDSVMDTLEETDIGQLLCYMLGHFVKALTNGVPLVNILPMLGIYVEGRKVTFNVC